MNVFNHINAKVDVLFQEFDNMSINTVAPPIPACEIYGVANHTGSACQVMSTRGIDQDIINYVFTRIFDKGKNLSISQS